LSAAARHCSSSCRVAISRGLITTICLRLSAALLQPT
jgi:hypothetical protein